MDEEKLKVFRAYLDGILSYNPHKTYVDYLRQRKKKAEGEKSDAGSTNGE